MSKFAVYDLNTPNAFFRLNGRRHQIVRFDGSNREVFECETGEAFSISHDDWITRCDDAVITDDFVFGARKGMEANLARPWDTFTPEERRSALDRHPYFMAMDDLKAKPWERRVAHLIEELIDKVRQEHPELPPMTVEAIRKWDTRWIESGRDIRGLCDLNFKKGNRVRPEELAWIDEAIDKGIREYMIKHPHLSTNQVSERLQNRLKTKAADEGLALPARVERLKGRSGRAFGHFRVQRRVYELNFRERKVTEVGLKEAKRLSAGIAKGPEPERPLMEAESDHSVLDIILVDEEGKELGRAWLTTIFDRCTRQILGFYISLEPPSWTSLLQALLVAVRTKKAMLDKVLDYQFANPLNCYGVPTKLFVDRGAEFIGHELAAFGSLLGCRIKPLPRASGDKKGKIERNYGTINGSFMSELPGYTGNRPDKKIREEFFPRMTLEGLNRLFISWWVDKYQVDLIADVGKPKLLWEEKMTPGYRRRQPSEDLLGPLESPLHTRTLRVSGIRIDNFVYQSDELRMLLHRLGEEQQVIVRPDVHDGDVLHVFDASAMAFVQGYLEGPYAGLHLPRKALLERHKADNAPKQTEEELLNESRGRNRFYDEIDSITKRQEQQLPDLSLPAQKRSEHVEREIFNPKASAGRLRSHDELRAIEPSSNDSRGPYNGGSAFTRAKDGRLKPSPIPGTEVPPALDEPHTTGDAGGTGHASLGEYPRFDTSTNPSRDGPPLRDDDDIDDDDVQSW